MNNLEVGLQIGNYLSFVKAGFLFFLAVYIIFAFVVVRQVKIMTDTLEVGLEFVLLTAAVAHFIFSIGVFILSLVVL